MNQSKVNKVTLPGSFPLFDLIALAKRNGCGLTLKRDGGLAIVPRKMPSASAAATADAMIKKDALQTPGLPLISLVKE